MPVEHYGDPALATVEDVPCSPTFNHQEHTMKSIITLASFLFLATLSVGCATVDLNSEGGSSMSDSGQIDVAQQLADSSAGK